MRDLQVASDPGSSVSRVSAKCQWVVLSSGDFTFQGLGKVSPEMRTTASPSVFSTSLRLARATFCFTVTLRREASLESASLPSTFVLPCNHHTST